MALEDGRDVMAGIVDTEVVGVVGDWTVATSLKRGYRFGAKGQEGLWVGRLHVEGG